MKVVLMAAFFLPSYSPDRSKLSKSAHVFWGSNSLAHVKVFFLSNLTFELFLTTSIKVFQKDSTKLTTTQIQAANSI